MQNIGVPLVLNGEMLRFHWWIMSAGTISSCCGLSSPGRVGSCREDAGADLDARPGVPRLLEAGDPFLAIRYDELDADLEGVAGRLLAHAGLPASGSSAAVKAFARNSQAGTRIGPDRRDAAPFAATVEEKFRSALARQPRIASPDVFLPDTYS